jgi:hypothetical protein
MIKMKISKNTYLRIAGFNFKIELSSTFEKQTRELMEKIINYYQGFIFKKTAKIDFLLKINKSTNSLFIISNKKNITNVVLFVKVEKRKIITFSYISLEQFKFIISLIIEELLQHSGFIFHSSAVAKGNGAFLFTGSSRMGKSTVMKLLSKKYSPIADDSIVIKKENKQFFAYQTFLHEKNNIKKSPKRYKIEGVFLLKRSNKIYFEKMNNKKESAKKLLKQFFVMDKRYLSKKLKIFFDFLSSYYNFYFLHFSKKIKISNLFENFYKNNLRICS